MSVFVGSCITTVHFICFPDKTRSEQVPESPSLHTVRRYSITFYEIIIIIFLSAHNHGRDTTRLSLSKRSVFFFLLFIISTDLSRHRKYNIICEQDYTAECGYGAVDYRERAIATHRDGDTRRTVCPRGVPASVARRAPSPPDRSRTDLPALPRKYVSYTALNGLVPTRCNRRRTAGRQRPRPPIKYSYCRLRVPS